MSWKWVVRDEAGKSLRTSEAWPTREEAEAWLSQSWRDLLEAGGEAVSLMEDAREEYTMGLREGD